MTAWFDMTQLEDLIDSSTDDESGLLSSVDAIDVFIQSELDSGLPENKIILGGFSQGGAVSLLTALTGKRGDLAGVVVLGGWIVLTHKIEEVSFKSFSKVQRSGESVFKGEL